MNNNKSLYSICSLAVALLLFSFPNFANAKEQSQEEIDFIIAKMRGEPNNTVPVNAITPPSLETLVRYNFSANGIEKDEVHKAFQPVLADWAEYRKFKYNNYIRTFELQYYMTIVVFVMVICLVFFGCYLSLKHFQKDKTDENHELIIGKTGVKVSSPVIGLIILCISFAFFYAYLISVYKINVI